MGAVRIFVVVVVVVVPSRSSCSESRAIQ